jgi:DNA-directed RNA polymerase specialized sigma24 family protein
MTVDNNLARAILTRERVGAAIGQLSDEQQAVLALRFGEDLTDQEVGQIMGSTLGQVQALQRQGLAAIRRILAVRQ